MVADPDQARQRRAVLVATLAAALLSTAVTLAGKTVGWSMATTAIVLALAGGLFILLAVPIVSPAVDEARDREAKSGDALATALDAAAEAREADEMARVDEARKLAVASVSALGKLDDDLILGDEELDRALAWYRKRTAHDTRWMRRVPAEESFVETTRDELLGWMLEGKRRHPDVNAALFGELEGFEAADRVLLMEEFAVVLMAHAGFSTEKIGARLRDAEDRGLMRRRLFDTER